MRNRYTRPSRLPIGIISEGTLRTEDLLPCFLYEAERLRLSKDDRVTVQGIRRSVDAHERMEPEAGESTRDYYYDTGEADEDLDTLQTLLSNYVPDYAHFGTSEGDGACFGVWPSLDSAKDDRVPFLPELPPASLDAPFHVVVVSDHGNATLYRRAHKRWIEVWSVV